MLERDEGRDDAAEEAGDSDGAEEEEDNDETGVPRCCRNPGCCQGARKNKWNKIQQCKQNPGQSHMNCFGNQPPPRSQIPPRHIPQRHVLQENEVCCMCAKARSPKIWFPVPPNMWTGQDADF